MGSHDEREHDHDPFSKQVSNVNPNMIWTCLASTHNLFINGLVELYQIFPPLKKLLFIFSTVKNSENMQQML